jgi:hypothetical protein
MRLRIDVANVLGSRAVVGCRAGQEDTLEFRVCAKGGSSRSPEDVLRLDAAIEFNYRARAQSKGPCTLKDEMSLGPPVKVTFVLAAIVMAPIYL